MTTALQFNNETGTLVYATNNAFNAITPMEKKTSAIYLAKVYVSALLFESNKCRSKKAVEEFKTALYKASDMINYVMPNAVAEVQESVNDILAGI